MKQIPMDRTFIEEVIISTTERRGKGTEGDPIRIVTKVYSKDGELIAEHDNWQPTSPPSTAEKETKPDWEIVSYKGNTNGVIWSDQNTVGENYLRNFQNPEFWLTNPCLEKFTIHAVKRLPDGFVFTVRGVYFDSMGREMKPIKKFFQDRGVMYAQFDEACGSNDGCLGINSLSDLAAQQSSVNESKAERIRVVAMWDLNNIYQPQCIRTGFATSNPIPEEKFPAIKQAIEQVLNDDKVGEPVSWEHHQRVCAAKNIEYAMLQEQLYEQIEKAFNAARRWQTQNIALGEVMARAYQQLRPYFIFETFSDYKQSLSSSLNEEKKDHVSKIETLHSPSNKTEEKPALFVTEDGKDIREGDQYWTADLTDWSVYYSGLAWPYNKPHPKRKYFSTKEAAENYVTMNKPCLSVKDIMQTGSVEFAGRYISFAAIEQLAKSKINNQ